MKELITKELKSVSSMEEVSKTVIQLLKIVSGGNKKKVGYIAGIISSDGKEQIKKNLKKMTSFTEHIRESFEFPVFSAVDIFTDEVFTKVDGKNITQDDWMVFWTQILSSEHITDIFMTPRWIQSRGAVIEHEIAKRMEIRIHYIKENLEH